MDFSLISLTQELIKLLTQIIRYGDMLNEEMLPLNYKILINKAT